jgi:hypothetical protein
MRALACEKQEAVNIIVSSLFRAKKAVVENRDIRVYRSSKFSTLLKKLS